MEKINQNKKKDKKKKNEILPIPPLVRSRAINIPKKKRNNKKKIMNIYSL
jgi:hypothetical protein